MQMKSVDLLSGSWYGDQQLSLHFPDDWDVRVVEPDASEPLGGAAIADRIARPLGSPDLPTLARGKQRAVIIIDDLTRPTPVAPVLEVVLRILTASGIAPENATVLVACGSHPSRRDRLERKTGELERQGVRLICHDARAGCVAIGSTRGGIPVEINRAVAEADLRIAVGGVYPHTFAGYSGGGKIILPGVSGIGTIQRMHDSLQGADIRGGRVDTEVRRAMSEVASMARLDFLVNVVLDGRRGIAGLFAGGCDAVYAAAVEFSRRARMVDCVREADIVVADSYPFDLDFQTLLYRGFWPFWYAPEGATKVAVAACSEGVGTHELFPVHRTLLAKVARRISRLHPADLLHPGKLVRSLGYYTKSRGEKFLLLSEGVTQEDIAPIYPLAEVHRSWAMILAALEKKHAGRRPLVALYRAAPLLVPRMD
jgi:nickel-dependent lactate racemase